jgi:hypothetical protein
MKEKLLKLAIRIPVVGALGLPLSALAQNRPGTGSGTPITTLSDALRYTCAVADWFFVALIAIAIIFVIMAAFSYLTAGGEPEKVKIAGHRLIYAAIAVAVAIVAKGFPLVIGSFFTGAGTNVCQ